MSNEANEDIAEQLEERAIEEGIWRGSRVYQIAEDIFGTTFAEHLVEELGCSEDICDGSGTIEGRPCPCKSSEE